MKTLRLFDRQAMVIVSAVVLLLAIAIPALVSAAQVTERSIALSSSSAEAEDVTYAVEFTAVTAGANAFVIDFCSNSPLLGQSCTAPTGLDVSAATVASGGATIDDDTTANKIVAAKASISGAQEIVFENIDNPTNPGTFYARIVTFATLNAAETYASGTPGTTIDNGGVALAITPTIGVSGAVLESLTFCVSKNTIAVNCSGITLPGDAPTVKLGNTVGDITVLQPNTLHTGSIYTQLSTNAAHGAVVSLKSDAVGCGGLLRAGAPAECDIAPALGTDVDDDANTGKFGVRVANATDIGDAGDYFGALNRTAFYDASAYRMNFVDANEGVTSTYGDPILTTAGAPAANKQVQLTFGVAANHQTPAGMYSADLSLIATGTF